MDTVKGILAILTVLFAGATFLLFIQYSAANSQLKQAAILGDSTQQLLRSLGATSCGSSSSDFTQMTTCMKPLLMTKDFKEDGFSQPDPKKGTGYLVIKNVNRRNYESERFTFYVNRELMQEGCTIPGTIEYNVACRFNFPDKCEEGTVLEVYYNQTLTNQTGKVFTKNC